jgi:aspartate aminotransferase-like enzyme
MPTEKQDAVVGISAGVFGKFWVQISARTPAIMTGFILLRFSKTVK